eukprot:533399-Lingulodinium_polyedra.AAC.1
MHEVASYEFRGDVPQQPRRQQRKRDVPQWVAGFGPRSNHGGLIRALDCEPRGLMGLHNKLPQVAPNACQLQGVRGLHCLTKIAEDG